MSDLVDPSGAKIQTTPAAGESKVSPLFFMSEEARTFIKLHGSPRTNRNVEDSFKAYTELSQKVKNELTFLMMIMPR